MKNQTLTAHLIPTEDVSELFIDKRDNKLHIGQNILTPANTWTNQHLYLCSTAEIKEGDWVYTEGEVWKHTKDEAEQNVLSQLDKKIIVTTDPKLWDFRMVDVILGKTENIGVRKIDGNTKAIIIGITNGNNYAPYYNVNFLEEYCKRYNQKDKSSREVAMQWWNNLSANVKSELSNKYYKETVNYNFTSLTGREIESIYNQKDNQKGVDVEKLKWKLTAKLYELAEGKIGVLDVLEWINDFNEALQSNAGGFSLEEVLGFQEYQKNLLLNGKSEELIDKTDKERFEDYLQSLQPQSKRDEHPNGRCQREEESESRCDTRCDHCIKYYEPIDSQDVTKGELVIEYNDGNLTFK